jgi:four helix bundle suffix protein
MKTQYNKDGFIPKHGGYKQLKSFQKAEIIYDGTYYFSHKYFQKYDCTIDQMIQAARSGKQNIIERSMASGTSKEAEIKLTIESSDPEVAANVMISLINTTSYLLAQQIKTLEKEFLQEGGLRERMSQARINVWKRKT